MWGLILGSVALVFSIGALVVAVFALMRVSGVKKDLETWVVDIKSRMSKLIKDINSVNELEYNVDVDQQNRINAMAGAKAP